MRIVSVLASKFFRLCQELARVRTDAGLAGFESDVLIGSNEIRQDLFARGPHFTGLRHEKSTTRSCNRGFFDLESKNELQVLLAIRPCLARIASTRFARFRMLGLARTTLNFLRSMRMFNWSVRSHLFILESRVGNEILNPVTQTNGAGSSCSSGCDWLGGRPRVCAQFENSFRFQCRASLHGTDHGRRTH